MTDAIRTPDELLEGLPDFPFAPHYAEVDDTEGGTLRVHYLDEGEHGAPVVLLMHGEPSWCFLYRHMIPVLTAAGLRCIAPDLPGFGRSDKPTDLDWYSYDRHVEAVAPLLEELDVRDATVVVHDWGGPVGLRLAVEHPDRIARIVVLDTGLFTGHQKMTEAWMQFRGFVERTEDLPVGFLVRGACKRDPGDAVIAAYDAPYPNPESKAGARAFPLMLPTSPEMPGAQAGARVLDALRSDERPKLIMWADSDPVLTPKTGERVAQALGTEVSHVIADASHFLQEDAGPEIGQRIAEWLTA